MGGWIDDYISKYQRIDGENSFFDRALILLRKARTVCNAAGLFVANYIYVLVASPALCGLDPQCTPLGCS